MKSTQTAVMSGRALRRQAQRDTASERSERAHRHVELFLYSTDDIAAGVTRVDYGPGAETSLEGARDGAIANVGAELVDSEPTTLQGRDGLAFSGTVEDGDGELLSQVYEDGTLLYQVIYTGRDIDADDEDVAAFFDSFQFTEER